jgi:hypothetical protein
VPRNPGLDDGTPLAFLSPRMPTESQLVAASEMSMEYWRRRRRFQIVVLSLTAGIALVCLLVVKSGAIVPGLSVALGVLIWFCAANIFALKYWTCPNCHVGFGRGHRAGRCDYCGISFPKQRRD